MEQLAPLGIGGALETLHLRLTAHFTVLAGERGQMAGGETVFALEHGLDSTELDALRNAVRAAVAQGFPLKYKKWWLPFVVYSAELGYQYVGGEYWHTFKDETPRWHEVGDNDWIRSQFLKFADQFAGVRPRGAFAKHCSIIAWPITHAVLPIYLQRNLAHLLYEFRGGLAEDLLSDPQALGDRLAARVGEYTERFRIFCENRALLGSVAIALLGEGSESPYLLAATQQRIVEDLSREQDSRLWLTSARQSASHVRAKGFTTPSGPRGFSQVADASDEIAPPRVDPKLRLRRRDGKWQVWALLPELTALNMSLGDRADELRGRNAVIQGVDGMLATDMHLRAGQMKRLNRWPDADKPFLQLNGASAEVNTLLAAQCSIQAGQSWLFRVRTTDLADQLRGRVVRPGRKYVVVQRDDAPQLQLPWQQAVALEVSGVVGHYLDIPQQLSESDRSELTRAGLLVVTDLTVQPVGLVPSFWDGEGELEWLAGEPAAICIGSGVAPHRCVLVLDGGTYQVDWPAGRREIFIQFSDMSLGRHEMGVRLFAGGGEQVASETLFITIRDPQVRPETASAAEGIRMFASPSRPTMADLWDGHASLTIEGPPQASAKITVTLKSEATEELARIDHPLVLPLAETDWPKVAEAIRSNQKFITAYDDAESVEISIAREGVGFATLSCDRGFQPLRWKIIEDHHENHFTARLVDRTEGIETRVDLFTVDKPLAPVQLDPKTTVAIPPLGGLLRATTGDFEQATILPPQPTEMVKAGRIKPAIELNSGSKQGLVFQLARGYRVWREAQLPGSVFAQAMRDLVLKAIAQKTMVLVSGGKWAPTESAVMDDDEPRDRLEELCAAVGADQRQVKLAEKIVRSFWEWKTPADLLDGFHKLIEPELKHHGISFVPTAFLLQLADLGNSLDGILDWDPDEGEKYLTALIQTPVVIRAARFAVLGARLFVDPDEVAKGF